MSLIIEGAGKKKKQKKQKPPVESPNTLRSTSKGRILDLIGYGPIKGLVDGLKSVFLDDTPVQNADGTLNSEGIDIDFVNGDPDQEVIPGFIDSANAREINAEIRFETPIVRSVTNNDADAVIVTLRIPALVKTDTKSGNTLPYTLPFSIQVLDSVNRVTQDITDVVEGKSTSPYEVSFRLELEGSAPYRIQVLRTNKESEVQEIRDDLYWATMSEIVDIRQNYPNCAMFGISVDSRLFGSSIPTRKYLVDLSIIKVPSNYNPETRAYSGFWDGTFKEAWTDNPAWAYYDLATHPIIGAGIEEVNKWALYEIARYCDELVDDGYGGTEPRFTCNTLFAAEEDAITALNTLASVFRGMTYWGSNSVEPVADMPGPIRSIITPSDVLDGEFIYQGTSLKERHSVAVVMWNDPEDSYDAKPEMVEDQESIELLGWRELQITAVACTSRGQARRLGLWALYSERKETQTVTFSVTAKHADFRPGDFFEVQDPYRAGARLGGRVKSFAGNSFTLDKVPTEAAAGWDITLELTNGGLTRLKVSSINGNTVKTSGTIPSAVSENSSFLLSSSAVVPQTFRVASVMEQEGSTYAITATAHDPRKYNIIENGLDLPDLPTNLLPSGRLEAPRNLTAESYTYYAGGTENQGLTAGWTAPRDPRVSGFIFDVKGPEDAAFRTVYVGEGLSFDLEQAVAGIWRFRVKSTAEEYGESAWLEESLNVGNMLMPNAPDFLMFSSTISTITVTPSYSQANVEFEFWRSIVALTDDTVEEGATYIGTGPFITDVGLKFDTRYHYYVRAVNVYGKSVWITGSTNTSNEIDDILGAIVDETMDSPLGQWFQKEIEKISAPSSVVGSVNDRITQVVEGVSENIDSAVGAVDKKLDGFIVDVDVKLDGAIDVAVGKIDTSIREVKGIISSSITEVKGQISTIDTKVDTKISEVNTAINTASSELQDQLNILNSELAEFVNADVWDPELDYVDKTIIQWDGSLFVAKQETPAGNEPGTSDTYWEKIGDFVSLTDAIGDLALRTQISETKVDTIEGIVTPMSTDINSLAARWREADEDEDGYLEGAMGAWESTASFSEEIKVRASQIESLSQRITSLSTSIGDVSSSITSLEQSLTSEIEAVAQTVTQLEADVGEDISAAILAERVVRVNAEEALASSIEALEVGFGEDISAGLAEERRVRVEADIALSERIDTVVAKTGDNEAAIQTEQTARTDADTALGARIDTVISSTSTADAAAKAAQATADTAKADAAIAAGIANSKGKVIIQSTAPAVEDQLEQNLWIDTRGGRNTPKRWVDEAWKVVTDKVATDAASAAATADAKAVAAQKGVTTNTAAIQTEQTARTDADTALGLRVDKVVASTVTADAKAVAAQGTADTAKSDAADAQGTADTAKSDAATAAGIANSKGKVLIQSTRPAVADRLPQNLWIDTTGGANTPKRWIDSKWEVVTDKVAVDAANAAAIADGKAVDAKAAAVEADRKAREAQGGVVTNTAAIVSESEARTDADTALGKRIDTVSSSSTDAGGAAAAAQATADRAKADASAAQGTADTAKSDAAAAAGIANSKGKVIIQSNTPAVADRLPQNLWIDTTGGANTPKRWTSPSWSVVTDKVAVDAANAAAVADGKAVTAKNAADEADRKAVAAQGGVTANTAAIQTEQTARTDADTALGLRVDTVKASTVTADAKAVAAQLTADNATTDAATAQGTADTAKSDAAVAAGIAEGKGKVLIQSAAPAVEDRLPQNLWIDTTGGANTPKRWNDTKWEVVTDKTAVDAADAAAVADGKATDAQATADEAEAKADDAQTGVVENTAAIQTETEARTTQNEAMASQVNSITAWTRENEENEDGDLEAAIEAFESNARFQEEIRVQTSSTKALAERITFINTEVGTLSSSITRVERSLTTEIEAVAETVQQLVVQVDEDISAALVEERRVRIEADEAISERIDTLTVEFSDGIHDNATAIQTEETTRADADTALGERIVTVTAQTVTADGKAEAAQSTADGAVADASAAQGTADTAKEDAATAAGIAKGKGKVLIQSTSPSVSDQLAQNLWIDTTGGANTPKRWNGSIWEVVTDKIAVDAAGAAAVADAKAIAAQEAADIADGKAVAAQLGVTTNTADIQTEQSARTDADTALGKRIDTVTSTTVTNTAAAVAAQATADTATSKAATAQGTADTAKSDAATAAGIANSKGKVIIQNTAPAAADRLAQNLWIDTTGGRNTPKRWVNSAWTAVTDKVAIDAANAAAIADGKADAAKNAADAADRKASDAQRDIAINTASIQTEQTARTTADTALGVRIDKVVTSSSNAGSAAIAAQATADQAKIDAANAAGLAGEKGKVIISIAKPAVKDRLPQNLWIDTTNGRNTPNRWDGSTWVPVSDKVATDAAAAAAEADRKARAAQQGVVENTAAIVVEQIARTDADTALTERIDTLQAETTSIGEGVVTNTGLIQTEQTARTDADSALTGRIDTLTSTTESIGEVVVANTAAIQTESSARTDLGTAVTKRIDTLQAETDGIGTEVATNTAAIQTEEIARTDADSALASQTNTIIARQRESDENEDGDLEAAIEAFETKAAFQEEITVRVSSEKALAERITYLTAELGDLSSELTLIERTLTTEIETTAQSVTSLSSRLDAIPNKAVNLAPMQAATTSSLEGIRLSNSDVELLERGEGVTSRDQALRFTFNGLVPVIAYGQAPLHTNVEDSERYILSIYIKSPVAFTVGIWPYLSSEREPSTWEAVWDADSATQFTLVPNKWTRLYVNITTLEDTQSIALLLNPNRTNIPVGANSYIDISRFMIEHRVSENPEPSEWIWGNPLDLISANSEAVQSLDTRVTDNEEGLSSQATSITNLTSSLDELGEEVDLKATASALQLLDVVVSSQGDALTSQGEAITKLDNDLNSLGLDLGEDITAVSGAVEALTSVVSTDGDRITSQGTSITEIENSLSSLGEEVDLKATSAALQLLDSKVETQGGVVTSQGLAITKIEGDITTIEGDVELKADFSALQALEGTVTGQGNNISSQGSAITELENSVVTIEGELDTKVSSEVHQGLASKVTVNEGKITSQGAALTQINTSLGDMNSEIGTKATSSALNALSGKVTAAEGKITSQAQSITQLNSAVGGNTSAIQRNFNTLSNEISSTAESITTVTAEVRGKNQTFRQVATPSHSTSNPLRVGDAWYRTNHGNQLYIFDGRNWVDSVDNRVGVAQSTANSANSTANRAENVSYNNRASIETISNAQVGARGEMDAMWGVKIQLDENNGGVVAGLGLGMNSRDGAVESQFTVMADRFVIVNRHDINGVKNSPFVVERGRVLIKDVMIGDGAINNARIGDAAIDSAKIRDAAINSAKIANLAVDTLKIKGNAVTVPSATMRTGTTSAATTIYMEYGGWIQVTIAYIVGNPHGIGLGVQARLIMNNFPVFGAGQTFQQDATESLTLSYSQRVDPGTYTFRLDLVNHRNEADNYMRFVQHTHVIVQGIKR